jgi:chromosome partitioning protein
MSHVIAIANQKGGVGKTTTAVNLGASLAAAERRTLVIDMDPQGNASSGLGVTGIDQRASLFGVLLDYHPLAHSIVRSVHLPLLDVVPTTIDLVGAEAALVTHPTRDRQLRRALDGIREMYDYVLVDCPPELGMLSLNALVAADTVLVPLQPEFFALDGLSRFHETVQVIREHSNPGLELEGILLTMYDGRLGLAREIASEAERFFGGRVFGTRIPRNVRLAEAPSFGMPALMYDAASPGAQAYLALADEILGPVPQRHSPTPRPRAVKVAGGAV